MLDTVPFTMCCYRSLYHCGDRQSWRWSSMLRMTMMTGVKMMVEVLFPSLDWHPTDHVSFSDNAHLRTIARESKVQVITMMAWLAQYDDIMHGYHHNDHQSLLSGPIAMSDIRRGHLWRAWRHPENGTSHVAKTLCPGIKSFCHQLITLIIPQCLSVILSTYISITKAIVNVKISTNITFQESWGAELHKDLKVWLKKTVKQLNKDEDKDKELIFDESIQVHPKAQVVHKGSNPHVDSYSAFFDNQKLSKTCLEELIRKGTVMGNCDFHLFKMSIFRPKILKIVLSMHLSGRRK